MFPDDEDNTPTQYGQSKGRSYRFDSNDTDATRGPRMSTGQDRFVPVDRPTMVRQSQPEIDHVGWMYCRKGVRKGQLHQFKTQRTEFGTAPDSQLVIEDQLASRHHGAVLLEGDVWKLFDFASTNGTLINGKRMGADAPNPTELHDGDVVTLGDSEFVFKEL